MISKPHFPLLIALVLVICSCRQKKNDFDKSIKKIDHVIVIYMENHSFDNLWGEFEGSNGLIDAPDSTIIQLDEEGMPYDSLPDIPRSSTFPSNLRNNYFNIDPVFVFS